MLINKRMEVTVVFTHDQNSGYKNKKVFIVKVETTNIAGMEVI